MKNDITFRIGCEEYGTSVIKKEECLLFVQTALENGSEVKDALQDMRMIDTLLHIKQLHLIVHGSIRKTRAGYFRKGSSLYEAFDSVIEGRRTDKF
jgi:hypothetical protein